MTQRHPDDALVTNPDDTAPPRPRAGQQSPRHSATQTTPWSPIPMTQWHPDDAVATNDAAPPRPRPGQQSPRHGATERTRCPAISMAQLAHARRPPWHSATHATRPPPIPCMAHRHPATPTRHAQQQSPWHSGTHAARPPAIPMAQRHTRHTRDTPNAHRHSLPLRSSAQRRTRDTPDAACRCVPRNVRSKLTSMDSLRLPRFRNAQRAPAHAFCRTGPQNPAILATAHDSLRLPRGSTLKCLPERRHASGVPCLPRETQVTARTRDAPRTTSPRQGAADTPATHPRHTSQHARSPQPATRNARWPCVYKTCPEPNPHGTAPRHTRGTPATHLQHARSPQPATQNAAQVAPSPPATRHGRNARGATARASLRAGFPHRATVSKTSSRPPRRHNRRI